MLLREISELIAYHSAFGRRFAEHDCRNVFEKAMKDLGSFGFGELESKDILDLGCGQRFPFALQCTAYKANVTALDLDYVGPHNLAIAFYRTIRFNGFKRAVKSLLRKMLFDGVYYDVLEKEADHPLREHCKKINFITADPTNANYPLPSESFDLIVSNAVIEHVSDISQFAKEIQRLLKKGGYFHGIIHNFYSLSGGHNLEWAFPDESPSSTVPPWDHLRENLYPAWSHLNRLTPEEYMKAFGDHLEIQLFEGRDINHDAGGLEGESILTVELQQQLTRYPRELLLTRSWCIVGRKSE